MTNQYKLQLKDYTDIKYARTLLNGLLYNNINYTIDGLNLIFTDRENFEEAKRMLRGYGIIGLEKRADRYFDGFSIGDGWWISPEGKTIKMGDETHHMWLLENTKYSEIAYAIYAGWIRISNENQDELDIDYYGEDKIPFIKNWVLDRYGQFKDIRIYLSDISNNHSYEFSAKDFLSKVVKSELLTEPEHQALEQSEQKKTNITDEKELTTYPKGKSKVKMIQSKYEDYLGVKINKKEEKVPTIALDFDGVIHGYSEGWKDGSIYDKPVEGVKDAIKELLEDGWKLVVYTTRENLDEAEKYIKDNFGEDIECVNNKPLADIYVDDRAINFSGDWKKTLKDIKNFKNYLEDK